MPTSMITLMPKRRSRYASSSMKNTSDIWPKVWMKAASGTWISFKNGFANV